MYRNSSGRNLTQEEIHDVLRNRRRRRVLQELQQNVGQLTVKGLAEAIAEAETGESPPPRNIRQSVYNSLHQTHLPKMDELNLVEYDRNRKTVSMEPNIRQVDLYMEVVTPYSITWAEFYQLLLVLALLSIVVLETGILDVAAVTPLVLSTLFLSVLVLSTIYRLWSRRWVYLQQLLT